jgi:hypothetical protein
MKLTQQDGARLMAAAAKWASAAELLGMAKATYTTRSDYKAHDAAEQRFAELVASLTDSEGL